MTQGSSQEKIKLFSSFFHEGGLVKTQPATRNFRLQICFPKNPNSDKTQPATRNFHRTLHLYGELTKTASMVNSKKTYQYNLKIKLY